MVKLQYLTAILRYYESVTVKTPPPKPPNIGTVITFDPLYGLS